MGEYYFSIFQLVNI